MLKTTRLFDMSGPEVGNGNNEVVRFGVSDRLAKKSGKSKGQNLSKFRKLAKLGKSLLKSGNLSNFSVTEAGSSFLTPEARETFNRL